MAGMRPPFHLFSDAPIKEGQLLNDKDKLYRSFLEGGGSQSVNKSSIKGKKTNAKDEGPQ